jgi:hypothetical protein
MAVTREPGAAKTPTTPLAGTMRPTAPVVCSAAPAGTAPPTARLAASAKRQARAACRGVRARKNTNRFKVLPPAVPS